MTEVWFFSVDGTTTQGPVDEPTARRLVSSGRVPGHGYLRHIGWPDWAPAAAVAQSLGWSDTGSGHPMPTEQPPLDPTVAANLPHPVMATPAAREGPNPGQRPASPAARAASWAIDLTVLTTVGILSAVALPPAISVFVSFAVVVAYLGALQVIGFDTLGHSIVGLMVVPSDDDVELTVRFAARTAIVILLALPLLIGLALSGVSMMNDTKHRAWHDLGSGCTVVRTSAFRFQRRPTGGAA